MIVEVKQVEPKLPLVIVTLPPNQNTPDYRALLASHGRMTATYKDLGAMVIDEKQVESLLCQQLDSLKIQERIKADDGQLRLQKLCINSLRIKFMEVVSKN